MLSNELWPVDVADVATCQACQLAERLPGIRWCELCAAAIGAWRRGLRQAEHVAIINEVHRCAGDGDDFTAELVRRLKAWGG